MYGTVVIRRAFAEGSRFAYRKRSICQASIGYRVVMRRWIQCVDALPSRSYIDARTVGHDVKANCHARSSPCVRLRMQVWGQSNNPTYRHTVRDDSEIEPF